MSPEPDNEDRTEPSPEPATPQTTHEERGEVQRKLGRCILRLQQYEMLCKAIMVASEVEGSPSTWEARQQARKDRFARMTLGVLIKEMKASWLARNDEKAEDDDAQTTDNLTEIWIRTRSRHTMDQANYERTIAAMELLVAMRNDLVQHFLEQFDLWQSEGCADGDRHLEQSYEG